MKTLLLEDLATYFIICRHRSMRSSQLIGSNIEDADIILSSKKSSSAKYVFLHRQKSRAHRGVNSETVSNPLNYFDTKRRKTRRCTLVSYFVGAQVNRAPMFKIIKRSTTCPYPQDQCPFTHAVVWSRGDFEICLVCGLSRRQI